MMISPRWMKLYRDLRAARGRMGMIVIAIAVGIFGVGTILSAYTILTREISRNYLGTNPASALLEIENMDEHLAQSVRQQPEIADAEAGAILLSRIEIKPNEWARLLLFVVPDFKRMRINTFQPETGAWPPPDGSILLEREALKLIKANLGDVLTVQTPNGIKSPITISGTVHDPGLAPAWQEQTVYGYISQATLMQLGESEKLNMLKVIVKDNPFDLKTVEQTISGLALSLKEQDYQIEEIRIPPPGMHPHQTQMASLLGMMLIFSFLALALSAVLTATLINGLLAQQVRQMGVMKAIGARSRQIAGMYLALVIVLGLLATLIGIPFGMLAGRGFALVVGQLLNFTIYSSEIPAWVFIVEVLAGTLIPLLVALIPISKATGVTVREAINDFGVSRENFGAGRIDALLGKIRGLDSSFLLALRNTFRRKTRLLLTLSLLAAAGAMFITSLNVKTAWEQFLADAAADRRYDFQVALNEPASESTVLESVGSIPGVKKVEAWNTTPAGVTRPNGLNIVRTYPDGGHGSFALRSVPPGSEMVRLTVLEGRWLQTGDTNKVVLNHMARGLFPDAHPGDEVQLTIAGKPATLTVVGIVRELLSPSAAYVSPETFAALTGQQAQVNAIRVVMTERNPALWSDVAGRIEARLMAENIRVQVSILETDLDEAMNGHIIILIVALILMAALMATVGMLGLTSTMSTNVVERTREFGIMRTIGGRAGMIMRNVIGEGLLIGLLSWVMAVALSLPLSAIVDQVVGTMAFRFPLTLVLSPIAMLIWLALIVFGAIAASAYPARTASQLTIRETLAYI